MSKKKIEKIENMRLEDKQRAVVIFNSKHNKYKIEILDVISDFYLFKTKDSKKVILKLKADTLDNLLDLFEDLIKDLR